jgi:hypothetical protein
MKRVVTWIVLAVFGMVTAGCTIEQPRPTAQAYPQYRQTADTQAQDSTDCSAWATDQTGYRPSGTLQGAGIGAAVGALGGAAAGPLLGLPLVVAQVPQRVPPLGPRLVVLGERSLVEL